MGKYAPIFRTPKDFQTAGEKMYRSKYELPDAESRVKNLKSIYLKLEKNLRESESALYASELEHHPANSTA